MRAGRIDSALRILSSDQDLPGVEVSMTGEGIELGPCVYQVSPNLLDFGTVEVSQSLTSALSIHNTGVNDCLMHSFELDNIDTSASFSMIEGPSGEVMLPPGGVIEVVARFEPYTTGERSAFLKFYVSDPLEPNRWVTLSGVGRSMRR